MTPSSQSQNYLPRTGRSFKARETRLKSVEKSRAIAFWNRYIKISATCIGYGYIQRRERRGHLHIRHGFIFEWLGSFRLEYDNKERTGRRNGPGARVGAAPHRKQEQVTWFSRGRVDSSRHASRGGQRKTVKMRIEELILEGFKSYPVRTQITGWDPSFNAITGLNGSGKSNILDAICFVLGLTNMSSVRIPHDRDCPSSHFIFCHQMRAQNQQDLIYKRGQAGITKASVTIVFDNSDRENSPLGMENYAQITVTRQVRPPVSYPLPLFLSFPCRCDHHHPVQY